MLAVSFEFIFYIFNPKIFTFLRRWVPIEFWKKLISETFPCDVEEIWLKEEVIINCCKTRFVYFLN